MEDIQTHRVLEALKGKPALLFQITKALAQEQLASPWAEPDFGSVDRTSPVGDVVANVVPEVDGPVPGRYCWWTISEDVGVEDSESEAQTTADRHLEAAGYLLCD